jgi:hypothetical protein
MAVPFISDRDLGDEQDNHIVHHPDCGGRGTARGSEWPMCCGSNAQIEEFYDEHFDEYWDSDYNLAEAEEE